MAKLPESHVLPGSAKENFWEMGDTGPCGPCSELHFDRIGGRECPELVNQDDPDVLEIWNLVFMQYNREPSGKLTPLPAGCIDTGMGLERLVSVLNNVRSNYDTDIFQPLFRKIEELCPNAPRKYEGKVGDEDPDHVDLAYRAVADHARTVTVAITDGAVPANEGRGYVIRRVLRRAVRYGRQILNSPKDEPWFYQLVDVVVDSLGGYYPELGKNAEKVKALIIEEEKQFGKTLDRGTTLFNRQTKNLRPGDRLEGRITFELLATYGFPVDLTRILCEERGLFLDEEGFEKAMEEHHKSSEGNANRRMLQMLTPDQVAHLEKDLKIASTQDGDKYNWDTTGDGPEHATVLRAIVDGKEFPQSAEVSDGTEEEQKVLTFIFDSTSFYAESGGQVGDIGFGTFDNGAEIVIVDTKRMGPYVLHFARVTEGTVHVGSGVKLSCDYNRRANIAKNHTGTHCLNYVLREVLGDGVDQAGSIVEPSRLRFDFTANKALTVDQIERIEKRMGEIIAAKLPVFAQQSPLETVKSLPGLRSLVGENYPDPVRVITVGHTLEDIVAGKPGASALEVSVEFCGGTHLSNSSEIASFAVISEESISRGVRRIVAATGSVARDSMELGSRILGEAELLSKMQSLESAVIAANSIKTELLQNKDSVPLVHRKKINDLIDAVAARKLEEGKARSKALKKEGGELGLLKGQEVSFRVDYLSLNNYFFPSCRQRCLV